MMQGFLDVSTASVQEFLADGGGIEVEEHRWCRSCEGRGITHVVNVQLRNGLFEGCWCKDISN